MLEGESRKNVQSHEDEGLRLAFEKRAERAMEARAIAGNERPCRRQELRLVMEEVLCSNE